MRVAALLLCEYVDQDQAGNLTLHRIVDGFGVDGPGPVEGACFVKVFDADPPGGGTITIVEVPGEHVLVTIPLEQEPAAATVVVVWAVIFSFMVQQACTCEVRLTWNGRELTRTPLVITFR